MPFKFKKLEYFDLPQPIIIETAVFEDSRGAFSEIYKRTDFASIEIPQDFVQFNYSISNKDIIRGLHYQLNPYAQGKLITVMRGSIMDVLVDIRKSSSTWLKYTIIPLNNVEGTLLYIPPCYAHGFLSLEDNTCVLYGCTNEYNKNCERSIRWNDPDINIKWNINNPCISKKDAEAPYIKDAEVFE
jgi:dTDP-4-dehydrorhamnose 3,5-epimerase